MRTLTRGAAIGAATAALLGGFLTVAPAANAEIAFSDRANCFITSEQTQPIKKGRTSRVVKTRLEVKHMVTGINKTTGASGCVSLGDERYVYLGGNIEIDAYIPAKYDRSGKRIELRKGNLSNLAVMMWVQSAGYSGNDLYAGTADPKGLTKTAMRNSVSYSNGSKDLTRRTPWSVKASYNKFAACDVNYEPRTDHFHVSCEQKLPWNAVYFVGRSKGDDIGMTDAGLYGSVVIRYGGKALPVFSPNAKAVHVPCEQSYGINPGNDSRKCGD